MKRLGVAVGMVAISAFLALFIDAITTNLLAFFGIVLIFGIGLLIVGLAAPVKRSKSGPVL